MAADPENFSGEGEKCKFMHHQLTQFRGDDFFLN